MMRKHDKQTKDEEKNNLKKENKKNLTPNNWVEELVSTSKNAVIGYEKYLLDEINYNELAKLITKLRKVLEKNGKI